MDANQSWLAVAGIILALLAFWILVNRKNPKRKRLSPLAAVAFVFVLAGIMFGENRWVGYSLMGIGIALSVLDMFRQGKK